MCCLIYYKRRLFVISYKVHCLLVWIECSVHLSSAITQTRKHPQSPFWRLLRPSNARLVVSLRLVFVVKKLVMFSRFYGINCLLLQVGVYYTSPFFRHDDSRWNNLFNVEKFHHTAPPSSAFYIAASSSPSGAAAAFAPRQIFAAMVVTWKERKTAAFFGAL